VGEKEKVEKKIGGMTTMQKSKRNEDRRKLTPSLVSVAPKQRRSKGKKKRQDEF